MLLYCVKCRKNTECKNPKVVRLKMEDQWFYQNVQCVIVKNRNLIKNKKLVDHLVV